MTKKKEERKRGRGEEGRGPKREDRMGAR